MKTGLIILLFLSLSSFDGKKNELIKIKPGYNYVKIDNLGNIFYLYEDKITKVDKTNNKTYEYSSKRYGNIQSIDTKNPLKILVFFKNTSKIIWLSEYLNPLSEAIDLYSKNIYNPQIVFNSSINGIWVYDKVKDNLRFLNNNLELQHKTQEFNSLNFQDKIMDINLINNNILINSGNKQLLFNKYGNFIQFLYLKNEGIIDINSGSIYYKLNNNILRTDFSNRITDTIYKNFKKGLFFDIHNNNIYIFKEDSITIKNL